MVHFIQAIVVIFWLVSAGIYRLKNKHQDAIFSMLSAIFIEITMLL